MAGGWRQCAGVSVDSESVGSVKCGAVYSARSASEGRMKQAIFIFCCLQTSIWAQEASSGFEVRATVSEGASYTHQLAAQDEGPRTGGFRAVLYPTWKLNEHWAVSGAIQTHSTPYFFEEFSTQHYGVKTDVLQANLSYSRFWNGGSVVVRLGELPSA